MLCACYLPWCGFGVGLVLVWCRFSRGLVWVPSGLGLGLVWVWCAHAVCRGVGLVWAWCGFGVGLVSVQSGLGLGSVWARSGFGVGLVCACCLPWCGFGVGSVWVGCGFGRVSEHPSCGPKLDRRKMHTKPTLNPEIEIRGLSRTRGTRKHGSARKKRWRLLRFHDPGGMFFQRAIWTEP